MPEPSDLERLQRWYAAQCDGEWEHAEGISIETLDNPGWMITVALADTGLESQPFERVEIDRSETDWLRAWVEDGKWHAACGPLNLAEALKTFFLFSGA